MKDLFSINGKRASKEDFYNTLSYLKDNNKEYIYTESRFPVTDKENRFSLVFYCNIL